MVVKVSNVRIPIPFEGNLEAFIKKKYKLQSLTNFEIFRRSIDARDKTNVFHTYSFVFKTNDEKILKQKNVTLYQEPEEIQYPLWKKDFRPIVVGFGPAGMFSALYLARCGAKPIIIERGSSIEGRIKDIQDFYENKTLNPESNILFGEGGAGAFSDGKLTTNVNDPFIRNIFKDFVFFGANEDILYDAMPHVGSDVLNEVVKNLRNEILSLGGSIYFNTCFLGYTKEDGGVIVQTTKGSFATKTLFLALGHSAYDTITTLYKKGVEMEPKGFSIGVRVEHKAGKINAMQYGKFAKYLPPAYYKTAVHLEKRNVYTFCMCPGGYVMAATNESEHIVTNGMSNHKRDGENSNTALLVEIKPNDYYVSSPLDGFIFQRLIEKNAFLIGKDYRAPANLMKEFLDREIATETRSVKSSYPHGIILSNLERTLPGYICNSLREAIIQIDKRLPGFNDPDAILVGVETRSSSPVRILRNEKRMMEDMIYPIGEGAGYAGGITSAALDGLKSAMKCMENINE